MSGGQFDSSKKRVGPVFKQLAGLSRDWVRELVALPSGGSGVLAPSNLDLTFEAGYWDKTEKGLDPPVALLSWLIRNCADCAEDEDMTEERRRLRRGDPRAVGEALHLLRTNHSSRGWWILEGQTCPDAFIETPDALIVVEASERNSDRPRQPLAGFPCDGGTDCTHVRTYRPRHREDSTPCQTDFVFAKGLAPIRCVALDEERYWQHSDHCPVLIDVDDTAAQIDQAGVAL